MATEKAANSRRLARTGGAIIVAAGFVLGISYYPLLEKGAVDPAGSATTTVSSAANGIRTTESQPPPFDAAAEATRSRQLAALQVGAVSVAFLLLYIIILRLLRQRDRLIDDHKSAVRRLREKVNAAESASRAKSDFLASMSSEFRVPLNTILGFTDAMRRERFGPIGTVQYKNYLDDILASGRHLLCIVDDVRDLSRVEAGKAHLELEQIPMQEIIDDCLCVVEDPQRDTGPEVLTRIDDPALLLLVDGRRMKQVLRNVLANAKSLTPPTGRIEIKARRSADRGVEITVSDNGIGMADEDLETVLTPFGDGEPAPVTDGTANLGLPLASALVEMHGGQLDIASRLGRGTRVNVSLPSHCIADPTAPRLSLHAA